MNKKLREISEKIKDRVVFYAKKDPDIEIEDKDGIPYKIKKDSLEFDFKGEKIIIPIPEDIYYFEFPGGNETIGDTESITIHTKDLKFAVTIEYSYWTTKIKGLSKPRKKKPTSLLEKTDSKLSKPPL